jgi:ubiquitin carboxyl-terminal hydrolase 25/28
VKHLASCIRSDQHDQSAALEALVVTEISRGRWTDELWQAAAVLLGFGKDNVLKLDWNADIEDEFALHAWKDALRRAWSDHDSGAQRRKELNEALRILAEDRGSIRIIEEMRNNSMDMDPDQAYRILEVPKDVEEDMLLMVYSMRVSLYGIGCLTDIHGCRSKSNPLK